MVALKGTTLYVAIAAVAILVVAGIALLAFSGGGREEKSVEKNVISTEGEEAEQKALQPEKEVKEYRFYEGVWSAEEKGVCDPEDECERNYALNGTLWVHHRSWDLDKDCDETGADAYGYTFKLEKPVDAQWVYVKARIVGQVTTKRGYGNARGFGWILGLRANDRETYSVGLCLAGDYGLRVCAPTYREGRDFPDDEVVKKYSLVWEPGTIIVDLNMEMNVYRKENGEWAYWIHLNEYNANGVLMWTSDSIKDIALLVTGGACANYMPVDFNVTVEKLLVG